MTRLERDEAEGASLLSDSVYQVLGNERRRYVLYLLARGDGPMDIGTLAERVASLETEQSVAEVSYDQRKSVYTGLYQNHLPKMERAGLVRSENGWERIELTDRGRAIRRRIEGDADRSVTDTFLYVVLPAFGVGVILGVLATTPGLSPVVGFLQGLVAGLGLFAVGYVLTQ